MEDKRIPSYEDLKNMFTSYVSNDLEAAEASYVIDMLDNVGCDAETRAALGLDYIDDMVNEEMTEKQDSLDETIHE